MAGQNIQKRVDPESLKEKNTGWRSTTHDVYCGTADDLIAAGLVRPEQLPGTRGMPTTATTFYDGQQMHRKQRPKHDERYLSIVSNGKRFRVFVGLSDEEVTRRRAAAKRSEEHRQEQEGRPDPRLELAKYLFEKSDACLEVGEQMLIHGMATVVTGEYGMYCVANDHGECFDSDGKRFDHRCGYLCRNAAGAVFFSPPHLLRRNDGKDSVSHLRLVWSQRAA